LPRFPFPFPFSPFSTVVVRAEDIFANRDRILRQTFLVQRRSVRVSLLRLVFWTISFNRAEVFVAVVS